MKMQRGQGQNNISAARRAGLHEGTEARESILHLQNWKKCSMARPQNSDLDHNSLYYFKHAHWYIIQYFPWLFFFFNFNSPFWLLPTSLQYPLFQMVTTLCHMSNVPSTFWSSPAPLTLLSYVGINDTLLSGGCPKAFLICLSWDSGFTPKDSNLQREIDPA